MCLGRCRILHPVEEHRMLGPDNQWARGAQLEFRVERGLGFRVHCNVRLRPLGQRGLHSLRRLLGMLQHK